jgi:hypothetical protein
VELILLGLMASIGLASYALWSKSRPGELPEGPRGAPLALEAAERTCATLEPGDIVQHLGTDWLVEGAIGFAEPGGQRLYRLSDGNAERFLHVASGELDPSLLARTLVAVEGAPETLAHAGEIFRLKTRTVGQLVRSGAFSARADERFAGERATISIYETGDARLVVIARGASVDGYLGERVPVHLLELLPGR